MIIRQLYLMNNKGIPFYFDYRTHTLVSNLAGFGFTHEFTYLKFDNFYERVDKSNPLSEINATLTFLKGYRGYSQFLEYLKDSDKNLRLYYYSDSLKYTYIEIKTLTKTELQSGVLQCEMIMDKKSLWLKDQIITIDVNTDSRGKVYAYTYPYSYSISFEGITQIQNSGSVKAPLKIEIIGAVNNPEVNIKKNEEVIATSRLYVSSQDCKIEINSDVRNQYMIMEEAGVLTEIYQYQDFTCDNFLFIEPGNVEIEFKPGVSSSTICKLTMTEGYVSN
jgi:phage-related protein